MESTGPESGESIPDRYELQELIGEGGMGKVYRAYDAMLGRVVAIKILHAETCSSENQERFLREARALALLDHPNIVRIYGSGVNSQGNPFHVMEFLAGDSLAKELKAGPLAAPAFFEAFANVLAGLCHAHENKIVHRDLKPSNIIHALDSGGSSIYKIIDFGLARIDFAEAAGRTLTRTDAVMGSPNYMSPEQCRGQRGDSLSDIYSLGCIMYECISGAPPFRADSSLEVMYKHMNEVPQALPGSLKTAEAKGLAALVAGCLEKEAANRPQTVAEIACRLKDFSRSWLTGKNADLFFKPGHRRKSWGRLIGVKLGITVLSFSALWLAFRPYLHPEHAAPASGTAPVSAEQSRISRMIEALNARPGKEISDYFKLGRYQLKSSNQRDIADAELTYTHLLQRCRLNGHNADKRAACFTLRAKAEFCQGKYAASALDFDQAVKIASQLKPDSEVLKDILLERIPLLVRQRKYEQARQDLKSVNLVFKIDEAPDFSSRIDRIESFAQRMDTGGEPRTVMIEKMAVELLKMEPQSDREAADMLALSDLFADRLHFIMCFADEKAINQLSERLRERLKGKKIQQTPAQEHSN